MIKKFVSIIILLAAVFTIILGIFYFIDRESSNNDNIEIVGYYYYHKENPKNKVFIDNISDKLKIYKIYDLLDSLILIKEYDFDNLINSKSSIENNNQKNECKIDIDSKDNFIQYFKDINYSIDVKRVKEQFENIQSYWIFKIKNKGDNLITDLNFSSSLNGYYSYSIKHNQKGNGEFNEIINFNQLELRNEVLYLNIWSTEDITNSFNIDEIKENIKFLIQNKEFNVTYEEPEYDTVSYFDWITYILIALGFALLFPIILTFFNIKIETNKSSSFKIINAVYGTLNSGKDVTEKLQKLIHNNKLEIIANNDIDGDPDVGTPKTLWITYEYEGDELKVSIKEGESLSLP